jgi:hypothetical protein
LSFNNFQNPHLSQNSDNDISKIQMLYLTNDYQKIVEIIEIIRDSMRKNPKMWNIMDLIKE